LTLSAPAYDFIISFLKEKGLPFKNISFHSMAGDGSKRLFKRIIPSNSRPSFVFMENSPSNAYLNRENTAYLMIGKHLFQKGLPVPEIYRFDLSNGFFILEDMGDKNLQDISIDNKNRMLLYEKAVDILFKLQVDGAQGFDTEWCCQTKKYDTFVMRRYESEYFRDSFLSNYMGLKSDWPELEGPFIYLSSIASKADNEFLLHRDFQSRNIMVDNNKFGILDWQGARLGPLPYDLASLIIDPYVNLSANERIHVYQQYLSLIEKYYSKLAKPFEKYFPYLAVQRNLQIIGAFSYLSKVQGKKYFEAYLPAAIKSLDRILDELADSRLSLLTNLVHSMALDY
jgi:aminoglycoside/choline kinase family phosphotransferase